MTESREVISRILQSAGLDPNACAMTLGIAPRMFGEMLAGQRLIPDSFLPLIAAVVGVRPSLLEAPAREQRNADVVPAIWYKLRAPGLVEADREYVLGIRQLAYYVHELEQITDMGPVGWKTLFEELRRNVDPQSAPREQGRQAARRFRSSTGLDKYRTGIGEVFRGVLRNMGVLLLETPAQESALEGCSFYVGPSGSERPCVFANSYRSTWFRRNRVLMHEMAHAIFDVESGIASLDFANGSAVNDVQEQRADGFAQECLVPWEVLRHWAQQSGAKFELLSPKDLALLVAFTHVEQRLAVKALADAGFVGERNAEELEAADISALLRGVSDHALSTKEFIRKIGNRADDWIGKRTTTTTAKKLLLPARYVDSVVSAYQRSQISRGKAARMLMIEEPEFDSRFRSETTAASEV